MDSLLIFDRKEYGSHGISSVAAVFVFVLRRIFEAPDWAGQRTGPNRTVLVMKQGQRGFM